MTPRLANLSVSYPVSTVKVKQPLNVRIRQNEFMHDMAVIRYDNVISSLPMFRSGHPVRIVYGYQNEQQAEFCGYVLWSKPSRPSSGHKRTSNYLTMTCIGASRLMQAPAHRVHPNLSINQIVGQVASEYHFDVLRGNLTHRWGNLVNAGKSDFQHLMGIAKRSGQIFYVHNTTLCMYDPVDFLLKHASSWPRLRHEAGAALDSIMSYEGTVTDDGANLDDVGVQRLYYIDPVSGDVTQAGDDNECAPHLYDGDTDFSSTAPFNIFIDDEPAPTAGDAGLAVNGRSLANRWRHSMKTHGYGDQRVHQGTGVVLSGIGTDSDGLWYVKSTEHEFDREGHLQQFIYTMDMGLRRDSRTLSAVPAQPTTKSVRREMSDLNQFVNGMLIGSRNTGPVLRGGHWVTNHPGRTVLAA